MFPMRGADFHVWNREVTPKINTHAQKVGKVKHKTNNSDNSKTNTKEDDKQKGDDKQAKETSDSANKNDKGKKLIE